MKKILAIAAISSALFITGCGKYVTMNYENYEILNRGNNNILKVVAKFEKKIEIDYLVQDTIVATVNDKGNVKKDKVTRIIDKIPSGAKVKIKDPQENGFTAVFIDYNLSLPMIRSNEEFVIMTNRDNAVEGTRYTVKDSDPRILVKIRNVKSKQYISLKK